MRTMALLASLGLIWAGEVLGQQLSAADVQRVINQAVKRANKIAPQSVIAVTDREGYVLGVSVRTTQSPAW